MRTGCPGAEACEGGVGPAGTNENPLRERCCCCCCKDITSNPRTPPVNVLDASILVVVGGCITATEGM